jgi:hypothetical protein
VLMHPDEIARRAVKGIKWWQLSAKSPATIEPVDVCNGYVNKWFSTLSLSLSLRFTRDDTHRRLEKDRLVSLWQLFPRFNTVCDVQFLACIIHSFIDFVWKKDDDGHCVRNGKQNR